MMDMDFDIEAFYRDGLGLTNERTIQTLAENTTLVHHKKGELFFQFGEPATHVYFHLNGVTRGYLIDKNGEEQTFGFSMGRPVEPCVGAGAMGEFARNYVQALVDMDSLQLNPTALARVLQTDTQAAAVYAKLIEADADKHFYTQLSVSKLPGKERYLWFLENYAAVADLIPQMYIASFLGLKPQSLSRIKVAMEKEAAEKTSAVE